MGYFGCRQIIGGCLTLFLAVSPLLVVRIEAAHSRKRHTSPSSISSRFSTPRYDRAITTFDSTGRLLQVDYSKEAAERGSPVFSSKVSSEAILIFAKLSKVHRIDDHIFMVTTGLSGDGNAIAENLRQLCRQHRLSYGEPTTVRNIAEQAAMMQHELTRTGGARPIGCTVIIAGFEYNGQAALFRIDPGGSIENCKYCSAGQRHATILKTLHETTDDGNPYPAWKSLRHAFQVTVEMTDGATDVWIIRRDSRKRGYLSAKCILDLSLQDLGDSLADLLG